MDINIYSVMRVKETNLTCASHTGVSVFGSAGKECRVSFYEESWFSSAGKVTGLFFIRGLQNYKPVYDTSNYHKTGSVRTG
jgi:hypothetical protein